MESTASPNRRYPGGEPPLIVPLAVTTSKFTKNFSAQRALPKGETATKSKPASMSKIVNGLYAPLITPLKPDGEIDLAAFEENLDFYETQALDGYLINGSSGEADMLTHEERVKLLNIATMKTQRPLLAGMAPQSLRTALAELEGIVRAQPTAILVRTPSYFGKQLDQVLFYTRLADASPVPIMIYQIPQYTQVKLGVSELNALAAHPNIVGIKDSLGDLSLLTEYDRQDHFSYMLGAAGVLTSGLSLGCDGGILALANIRPAKCRQLIELMKDGKVSEAHALQGDLIPINRAIGGSRGFGIAGLKAACEHMELKAGPPRQPLIALDEEEREALYGLLDD